MKESKEEFERMKQNVMEKIDMVSASRCNLLSRSLPYYQEHVLAFMDSSASNFHELLTSLQNQSQHQYKVRAIAEEIRDLSVEEVGYETNTPPELGKSVEGLADDKRETSDEDLLGVDESLMDIIDTPRSTPPPKQLSAPPTEENGMQTEEVEGSHSPTPDGQKASGVNRVTGEVSELLDLLSVSQPPASEEAPTGAAPKLQSIMDQWDEFSSFVGSSQPHPETSGWEHELSSPRDQPSSELQKEIDDMLGVIPSESDTVPDLGALDSSKLHQQPAKVDEEPLFDPLQQAALVEDGSGKPASAKKSALDDLTLESILPPHEASMLHAPLLSAPTQPHTHPALLPTQFPTSTAAAAPTGSPWGASATPPPSSSGMPAKPSQEKAQAASAKKNPNSWMNVFAHLDPLANEKA